MGRERRAGHWFGLICLNCMPVCVIFFHNFLDFREKQNFLETKVQTPYPLIFPIFYHYFFGERLFGFLSSIYSPNHILVFLSSPNPCARPFFSFCIFVFSPCDAFFLFSFSIFVFSPCAMTIILILLIAMDLLKRHRFWARS